MKRFLSIILAAVLIFGIAACGAIEATPDDEYEGTPGAVSSTGEIHKIGVLVYSDSNEEVLSFKEYLKNYIEQVFPDVQFLYSGAILSKEEQISTMESMIDMGVEGFMAFTAFDMEAELALCEKNEVYYMRPAESISDEEFNAVKDNKYFIGVVGPSSEAEYQAGYDMGKHFANISSDGKYFILSGGAGMANEMHLQRTVGILDALQEEHGVSFEKSSAEIAGSEEISHESAGDLTVCVCPGYVEIESFLEPARAEYNEDKYEVMLSVLPLEEMANEATNTGAKVGVIDCYSIRNLQLFNAGILDYVVGKYPSIVGPSFAAMYNAVTGFAENFRNPDGSAFNIKQGLWTSDNKEDYTEKYSLTSSIVINAYNYEDLRNVCKVFNPDATLDDLVKLAGAYTYEDVIARRGEQ